ncbi:MAG: cytochrome P460 family protein [Alphaproteobacteria bacterium]|nr:cytochrome P460 family protein [Alphaproteobacteria bacterium]
MRIALVFAAGTIAGLAATNVFAGTEAVSFPEGYDTKFLRYTTVDRPDRKPAIVRFMYVNRETLDAARAGEPLPYGTVLVMEDHKARLDAGGAAVEGADGRLVATGEVTNVFVQQKEKGWGADYPDDVRNGEWEYAWFLADGSRKPDAKFDRCFSCHAGQADDDYNFTFGAWLNERGR